MSKRRKDYKKYGHADQSTSKRKINGLARVCEIINTMVKVAEEN